MNMETEPTLKQQVEMSISTLKQLIEKVPEDSRGIHPVYVASGVIQDIIFYFEELLKKVEEQKQPFQSSGAISSFEYSTTAKGELTYSAKVYHPDVNEARKSAENQVLEAEKWKKEFWLNKDAIINSLVTRIENLEATK